VSVALAAALFFWPSWEREKFPALLAKAIEATRDYFDTVAKKLLAGASFDAEVIRAKQAAERASIVAAASLQRMSAEPMRQQAGTKRAGALVTSCERVCRAITVAATQLGDKAPQGDPQIIHAIEQARVSFDELMGAAGLENKASARQAPETPDAASIRSDSSAIGYALEKISAEVRAMLLAAKVQRKRGT
jgi:uncharacterized membrane protein YccC